MKKILVLFLCAFMGANVFAASIKKGNTVYVSAKTVALKDGSGNFAKNVKTLSYGDQLKVLAVEGKKAQVQLTDSPSTTGWVPTGNVTTKKIVKKSSGGTVSASAKELALAGKGFSEESEGVYKASHTNLNFKLVDSIEALVISESDMKKFLVEGKLKGAENEAK